MATKRQPPAKKKCSACGKELHLKNKFYINKSPLHALDGRDPICKDCIAKFVLNKDGSINEKNFKKMLQQLDKPYYKDNLISAENQFRKENGNVPDDEVQFHGQRILGLYFTKLSSLRQLVNKTYADSERDGFVQKHSTVLDKHEKTKIKNNNSLEQISNESKYNDTKIYSQKWRGKYSESDLEYLDNYYNGLERDYNIITENHRDYARKIAKASLQMDKAFDEMLNNVSGADSKYKIAQETFDKLSKSAKFSESSRKINDIGSSSFSKIASMVESHNWIPEHTPLEKDDIDKLLDALSTAQKSF